jgi:hypothetical protein
MSTRIDDSINKAVVTVTDKIPLADGTLTPRHYTVSQIADSSTSTGVTPGSYTLVNITVNAQGKITSAADGNIDGGFAT